jgi:hypothetical protein
MLQSKKICIVCGDFLTGKKRKYCSNNCYTIYKKSLQYESWKKPKNCLWCRNKFKPKSKMNVYCSQRCRQKHLIQKRILQKEGNLNVKKLMIDSNGALKAVPLSKEEYLQAEQSSLR